MKLPLYCRHPPVVVGCATVSYLAGLLTPPYFRFARVLSTHLLIPLFVRSLRPSRSINCLRAFATRPTFVPRTRPLACCLLALPPSCEALSWSLLLSLFLSVLPLRPLVPCRRPPRRSTRRNASWMPPGSIRRSPLEPMLRCRPAALASVTWPVLNLLLQPSLVTPSVRRRHLRSGATVHLLQHLLARRWPPRFRQTLSRLLRLHPATHPRPRHLRRRGSPLPRCLRLRILWRNPRLASPPRSLVPFGRVLYTLRFMGPSVLLRISWFVWLWHATSARPRLRLTCPPLASIVRLYFSGPCACPTTTLALDGMSSWPLLARLGRAS